MNLQQTREFMRHATDTALIVVDYQNDFVQYNGALYVPNAELLLPNIAAYTEIARNCSQSRAVFFTADWHPAETLHFDTWPKHCVQNTYGAQIFANLAPDYTLFKKGRSDKDDYSAMNASIF
jgi:nicotinamidase/pyrazinamidase